MELDVIIPVKDRATIAPCVTTIRQSFASAGRVRLGQILICDGGSQAPDCRVQLQQIRQWSSVKLLNCPHPSFNKGWLLNQGLLATTAPLVLISDVDILWNRSTLEALSQAAMENPDCFYHIQTVKESDPQTIASQRPRYGYHLSETPQSQRVEIVAQTGVTSQRPGYGLLCAQRRRFEQVGGYRQDFQGWGWEDQDLLMRSQLLGCTVHALGTVIHRSHHDRQRNPFTPQQTPQQSRDRNILRCLAGLAQGKLLGDLSPNPATESAYSKPISIDYPASLDYAADPDHPLPRSPAPPQNSA